MILQGVRKESLPVVGSTNDKGGALIELDIIYRRIIAFINLSMSEHGFQPVKVLNLPQGKHLR